MTIKVIDNTPDRKLKEAIKENLKNSKYAKFAVGYFFLNGFDLVKENFPDNSQYKPFLKIVMGNETTLDTKQELSEGFSLREKIKLQLLEQLQDESLSEKEKERIRNLRDLIAKGLVDVKLYDKTKLHAKLYLFLRKTKEERNEWTGNIGVAIVGSSNFTAAGLENNKELNVFFDSSTEVEYLENWFDTLWDESVEFKEDLLKIIEFSGITSVEKGEKEPLTKIGKRIDPETLFKYLVYRWFDGRVANILKKDVLAEFQLIGVVNAVNVINYYNGVILADSVGLGKSFTSSAIIEEFILGKHPTWYPKGKIPSVMLILPPPLIQQWKELLLSSGYFFKGMLKRQLNTKEDLKYEVFALYDGNGKLLGKIAFMSMGIFQNLDENQLNFIKEEYDFFVIDEAHKYRNSNTKRWNNARALQVKNNKHRNKYMLLTATPINNSIADLFNLIRIFTDDTFTPFRLRKGVIVGELIRKYNSLKKKSITDDKAKIELQKIVQEIKRKVLDEVMILRTRKYIKEQFKDIEINGRKLEFKDPNPYAVDYSDFSKGPYKELLETIKEKIININFEHTKLYGAKYIIFEDKEATLVEGNKEEGKYLIEIADLFRLLLGKRLESSIYSFEITLKRIYEKEKTFYNIFQEKIEEITAEEELKETIKEALEKAGIEKELEEVESDIDIDVEREIKLTWFDKLLSILKEYAGFEKDEEIPFEELIDRGLRRILNNIKTDIATMEEIFKKIDAIKQKILYEKDYDDRLIRTIYFYKDDPKLHTLKLLLGTPSNKLSSLDAIPSLFNRKILIFTQYKDTAYYLHRTLKEWIENEPSLQRWLIDENDRVKIGLVTGDTDTETKMNIIRRFSPTVNSGKELIERDGEINLLISTDVLSEGVNLQDADVVVNYDLPWNPMVIVQRVGRVNRIGSEKDIDVINFVPSEEIEVVVGVLRKLQEKIRDITLIVGKDVRILSQDEKVSVETFGEKIKEISKQTLDNLEEYGISSDFKALSDQEIPKEQIDEFKLLNIIQYELGYTEEDFNEINHMEDNKPFYTIIGGEQKFVSVYEFYRGGFKIDKKVIIVKPKGNKKIVEETTPLAFLELVRNKKENGSYKVDDIIENLESAGRKAEEIKKEKEQIIQAGKKRTNIFSEAKKILVILSTKQEHREEKEKLTTLLNKLTQLAETGNTSLENRLRDFLSEKGVFDKKKNVFIGEHNKVYKVLEEFLDKETNVIDVESFRVEVKPVGWFYEC